jgi:hypothetical protein
MAAVMLVVGVTPAVTTSEIVARARQQMRTGTVTVVAAVMAAVEAVVEAAAVVGKVAAAMQTVQARVNHRQRRRALLRHLAHHIHPASRRRNRHSIHHPRRLFRPRRLNSRRSSSACRPERVFCRCNALAVAHAWRLASATATEVLPGQRATPPSALMEGH